MLCMLCMVGSSAISCYAACAIHSDHYRSCIVPTQAGVWKAYFSDSPCVCRPCLDVLWPSCFH